MDLRSGNSPLTDTQIFNAIYTTMICAHLHVQINIGMIKPNESRFDLDQDGVYDMRWAIAANNVYLAVLPDTKISGDFTLLLNQSALADLEIGTANYYSEIIFRFPEKASEWDLGTCIFDLQTSGTLFFPNTQPAWIALQGMAQQGQIGSGTVNEGGTVYTTYDLDQDGKADLKIDPANGWVSMSVANGTNLSGDFRLRVPKAVIDLYFSGREYYSEILFIFPDAFINPFVDVKEGKYYYNPVMWAYYHNPQIVAGTGATTFSPNATCTRAQIVTFLWRAAGSPEPTTTNNPFKDVSSSKNYYKAVLWAAEKHITSGTAADKFSQNAGCTRAQVVSFLWRYAGSPEPATTTNPFTDVPSEKYYTKAVLWAAEKGVTAGTSTTTFSPDKTCTRGQIVSFLYRYMEG